MVSSVFVLKWKTTTEIFKKARVLKLSHIRDPFNLDSMFWPYIPLKYPSEWILPSEQACLTLS